jgi:hypothetical protein
VQKLTTSLLLGRLLATKAYLQKMTDPKLSKLSEKPNSTSYAREDTMNKASVSKMRCGIWGVSFVFLMGCRFLFFSIDYAQ